MDINAENTPLRLLIIANPTASGGKAKSVLNRFETFLALKNQRFDLHITNGKNDKELIRNLLINSNITHISVIGGDGTMNLVLNALPHLNYTIHLIPAGTGNDLAKMLYQNKSLAAIFDLLFLPVKIAAIDCWKCNEYRFSNAFGAGFDGEIAQRMFNKRYWLPSKLKYWVEIFKLIFTYKSSKMKINDVEYTNFMIAAANGRVVGGGFKIAPLAEINDGLLELILVKKVPVLKRLFYLPIIEKGKHLDLSIVKYSRTSKMTIQSTTPLPAQIDGEPLLASKYEIFLEGRLGFLV